jgi:thiosulfate/3-mercaptopyruvate sulfurtransferase
LVEPGWLAKHLDDPDLRIIDCDPAETSFTRAHIPGAVLLGVHPYLKSPEGVLPAEQIEAIMRGLGVNNSSRVVLYDSMGSIMAARVWWVLWYYGFEQAVILNGGWPAWQSEGFPTSRERVAPPRGDFTARAVPERIGVCEVMLGDLRRGEMIPLDVRDDLEWSGLKPAPNLQNQREGRMPGAVHIEWKEFVDWDNHTRFKSPEWIRERLESAGVTRGKRVVPY